MQRRLVKQGNAALTVTLPSSWVKKFGLKQGDEVTVEESGKMLHISHIKPFAQQQIIMQLSNDADLAARQISFGYKKGVDELELRFDDLKMYKVIHEALPSFLGYEIIAHGKNHCVIKNIASQNEEDFHTVLRRAFLVTLELAESSYESLARHDTAAIADLLFLEKVNNKLTDFCKRILNKLGYIDASKTTILYVLVADLEKIGDQYRDILSKIQGSQNKLDAESLHLYQETNKYLRELYTLFFDPQEESLKKFLTKKKLLINNIDKEFHHGPMHRSLFLLMLKFLVILIYEQGSRVYELMI